MSNEAIAKAPGLEKKSIEEILSHLSSAPKEVQTVDERVKLVYEVRLYANDNPGGRLNPGQPADAMVRWREEVAWQAPEH